MILREARPLWFEMVMYREGHSEILLRATCELAGIKVAAKIMINTHIVSHLPCLEKSRRSQARLQSAVMA